MPRTRLLLGLIAVVFVVSCSKHHEPTIFPTPPDAKEVYEVSLLDGQAYQAGFVLNVRYPSTVALEHYSKLISKPWYYCVWGRGEWESFLDATGMVQRVERLAFSEPGRIAEQYRSFGRGAAECSRQPRNYSASDCWTGCSTSGSVPT